MTSKKGKKDTTSLDAVRVQKVSKKGALHVRYHVKNPSSNMWCSTAYTNAVRTAKEPSIWVAFLFDKTISLQIVHIFATPYLRDVFWMQGESKGNSFTLPNRSSKVWE